MLNILIAEDDPVQCQTLTNYISKEIEDVRIYNISYSGKTALEVLCKEEIDIILLDLNLPQMSGVDIINYISSKQMDQYQQSIIIITGETELLAQIDRNNIYIFSYISKGNGMTPIIESIKKLIKDKNLHHTIIDKRKKILNKLKYLNYNLSHIGTEYLIQIILELCIRNNLTEDFKNLSKNIYPVIAKRYNTSVNNIKSNVTQATIYMHKHCSDKILKDSFAYSENLKPTIKEVIFFVLSEI